MATAVPHPRPARAHFWRLIILSVCMLLVFGILIGGGIGLLAVKVFDQVPLDGLSGNLTSQNK